MWENVKGTGMAGRGDASATEGNRETGGSAIVDRKGKAEGTGR